MAKTDNIFINFISDKMLHEQTNRTDGRKFYSVSVSCQQSINGFGTLAVTEKQVFNATKNHGKEVVAGFKNVLLGQPDKKRKLSIQTGVNADGKPVYSNIEMSNADILKAFDTNREAYNASAPAVAPAQA